MTEVDTGTPEAEPAAQGHIPDLLTGPEEFLAELVRGSLYMIGPMTFEAGKQVPVTKAMKEYLERTAHDPQTIHDPEKGTTHRTVNKFKFIPIGSV
jgi:hypothetical protein